MDREVLQNILAYIDGHICEKISLLELADLAGYSPFYFSKLFSRAMGISVTGYIRIRKLQFACCSLLEGKKVIEVSLLYGFESHEGFTRSFTRLFGLTPSRAKKFLSRFEIPDYVVPDGKQGGNCMEMNQNTLQENMYEMIFEVIKTSLEEAREGFCTKMEISVLEDGSIKIADNGRGIPLSEDTEKSRRILDRIFQGRPVLKVEYLSLDEIAQGPLQTVSSLCENLHLRVYRDGKCFEQDYVRGIAQHDVICTEQEHESGTEIVLKPDRKIFGDTRISAPDLKRWIAKHVREEEGKIIQVI